MNTTPTDSSVPVGTIAPQCATDARQGTIPQRKKYRNFVMQLIFDKRQPNSKPVSYTLDFLSGQGKP
jgi:hypothetical protein